MLLIINLILVIGITLSSVIIYLLVQKEDRAHLLLATIFGFLLIVCLQAYSEVNDIYNLGMVIFPFADIIGYAIGPLIYLYVVAIYRDHDYLKGSIYLMFVPLILCLIFLTIPQWVVFFGSDSLQVRGLSDYVNFISDHHIILNAQAIFLIICFGLSLKRLNYYISKVKNQFSDLTHRDIHWIRIFCILMIGLLMLFLTLVFFNLGRQTIGIDIDLITTMVLVIVIGFLGYFGTSQSHILLPKIGSSDSVNDKKLPSSSTPHHLSSASNDEIVALEKRLTEAMEGDQLYLQSNLSLADLAAHIQTTDKKLSALLNHHVNVTFYDYVNKYRIDMVKSRLKDPDYENYSILGIALDCGFNSKASFNRTFKQITKMSPSKYKSSKA